MGEQCMFDMIRLEGFQSIVNGRIEHFPKGMEVFF